MLYSLLNSHVLLRRKVRVALADFDRATDLNDNTDDLTKSTVCPDSQRDVNLLTSATGHSDVHGKRSHKPARYQIFAPFV